MKNHMKLITLLHLSLTVTASLMSTEPIKNLFVIILKNKAVMESGTKSNMFMNEARLLWDFLFSSFSPLRFVSLPFVLIRADLTFSSSFVSMLSFSLPFPLCSPFLTLCLSPSPLSLSLQFCLSSQGSHSSPLYTSNQQNVLSFNTCILPSDPSPTSFHPSLTYPPSLSLLRHPSPPCLPPEIITTSLVKISLYLNS